jgi:hypothetical protein
MATILAQLHCPPTLQLLMESLFAFRHVVLPATVGPGSLVPPMATEETSKLVTPDAS